MGGGELARCLSGHWVGEKVNYLLYIIVESEDLDREMQAEILLLVVAAIESMELGRNNCLIFHLKLWTRLTSN